jgi:hypothetical protein
VRAGGPKIPLGEDGMDFKKDNFEDHNELSRLEDDEELGDEIVETEEEELTVISEEPEAPVPAPKATPKPAVRKRTKRTKKVAKKKAPKRAKKASKKKKPAKRSARKKSSKKKKRR